MASWTTACHWQLQMQRSWQVHTGYSHLWLNLTEMKDADKIPFLDSPVCPTGLFGPSVEGFAERFTAVQKSSQAMRHFLPKRSSSAATSRCPKIAKTQQPAKAPRLPPDTTLRSARDPGPRLCWTQHLWRLPDLTDRKRREQSSASAGPPLRKPLSCLLVWVAALAPWKDHQWMEWGLSLGMVCRKMVSTDASNLGWGALCKPPFGPWFEEGRLHLHIDCLEICQHMVGALHLSARPEGKSRLSPFVQYDNGVLHKSPGQSFLEAPLYTSREPLDVGSAQLALAESSARVRETEPGSRQAISEQCPLRHLHLHLYLCI